MILAIEKQRLLWAFARAAEMTDPKQRELFAEYIALGGDYQHGFSIPDVSANDYAARSANACPPGARIVACHWGRGENDLPALRVRIGQYKARSGDPESPIYLCR